jgi:predicted 3-demethylubiquinone-9 3-methyltransferase (glyoxalase superfamily)
MPKFTPWLWFDTEGEAAASYVSIFPRSRITEISRYRSAGPLAEGTGMTVSFELDGQQFVALNGGPEFTFNEAISFQVDCKDQDEVGLYWSKLAEGGEEGALWVAQGQVRRVVADRSGGAARCCSATPIPRGRSGRGRRCSA